MSDLFWLTDAPMARWRLISQNLTANHLWMTGVF